MTKSNHIAIWREKVGITQQALADYLQVGRSLLSMVELGERELPLPAFTTLTQLMSMYDAISATRTPPPISPEHQQENAEALRQTIRETTWQLANVHRELATLETNIQQIADQLAFFQTIRQQVMTNPNEPHKDRQLLWLDIREAESQKRAATNHSKTKNALHLQIASLQTILQEAQKKVDELEGGM